MLFIFKPIWCFFSYTLFLFNESEWWRMLLTHLIPLVTIVTVKKVFIYNALKALLTDVLVHFLQIWKNQGSQNVQFHTISANCHMTRAVYFLFAAWEDDAASKLQKERLVKNVIIKIWQKLLVHVIFKVSSINICIHIISFVECGHRMSKHVDGCNCDPWDNRELRCTI